eukprot:6926648-Alexandrium_andersonii.AAC.1
MRRASESAPPVATASMCASGRQARRHLALDCASGIVTVSHPLARQADSASRRGEASQRLSLKARQCPRRT